MTHIYEVAYPIGTVLALLLVLIAVRSVYRATARTIRRNLAGKAPENVLTVVAAIIATTVQADGMWVFFRDVVPVPAYLRILMFAFLEVALFTSGLRARRNVRETNDHTAGVDGIAVWVLAGLSATLASTAVDSWRGALLRLAAPAVAAWLWERGLAGERRRARKKDRQRDRRINWRISPERILIRLGLADASDRTASDVDAHRRLTRVTIAAHRARTLRTTGAMRWRQRRAQRRLHTTMRAAVEYASLATDADRQAALLAQLGVLYNADALVDMTPSAPWGPSRPVPRLYRVPNPERDEAAAELLAEICGSELLGVPDRVPGPVPPDGPEPPDDTGDTSGDDDEAPVLGPVPPELERVLRKARRRFRGELAAGRTPAIRDLKNALNIGQDRAQLVKAYLAVPEHEPRTAVREDLTALTTSGAS